LTGGGGSYEVLETASNCSQGSPYEATRPRQTPPDLVGKFQPIDIVSVIVWLALRLRVVYQREIKG
jgi:hypothetical protein